MSSFVLATTGSENRFVIPVWGDHLSAPSMSLVDSLKDLPGHAIFASKELANKFFAAYKRDFGYNPPAVEIREI